MRTPKWVYIISMTFKGGATYHFSSTDVQVAIKEAQQCLRQHRGLTLINYEVNVEPETVVVHER